MKIIQCITLLSFAACTDSEMTIPGNDITGLYECKTPVIKNVGQMVFQQKFIHRTIGGVEILVVHNMNIPKKIAGPYPTQVYVMDGRWRFIPFYYKGEVKPFRMKAFTKEGRVQWEMADSKQEKKDKIIDAGYFRRDKKGDLIYGGKKQKYESRCQRLIALE